jgi:hypothetical protein
MALQIFLTCYTVLYSLEGATRAEVAGAVSKFLLGAATAEA